MLSLYPVFIIWIIKLRICWRYLQGLNCAGLIKSLSAANIASDNQVEISCTWQKEKEKCKKKKTLSRANKNLDESAGTQPRKKKTHSNWEMSRAKGTCRGDKANMLPARDLLCQEWVWLYLGSTSRWTLCKWVWTDGAIRKRSSSLALHVNCLMSRRSSSREKTALHKWSALMVVNTQREGDADRPGGPSVTFLRETAQNSAAGGFWPQREPLCTLR